MYGGLNQINVPFDKSSFIRLINPAKSIIGRVSKQILETINATTKEKTQVHQWKNTKSVIDWFKSLEDKSNLNFVQFDIVDFYPSISEELLMKAINYAKGFSQDDLGIIMHARKSLLFDKGTAWSKKNSDNTFDVTMGSFDGAEVCEFVCRGSPLHPEYFIEKIRKVANWTIPGRWSSSLPQ